MKQHIISALAVMLLASAGLSAQSFHQGFFLDGYRLNYRYNPAVSNDGNFLSVGQWSDQSINNVGAANFLYPREVGLVTAFHSSVSAKDFLGGLPDKLALGGNINFNLVSYGFAKGDNYHTIEANVRSVYGISLPKGIFAIVKLGNSDGSYDLSGIGLSGNAYAEIAYGYSRKLSDIVSIGARAKLLVGVEAIDYNVSKFGLDFTTDDITANLEADLDLTSRWSKILPDEDGYYKLDLSSLSAKDRWRLPPGAGLAFDFGIVVKPFDGLTLSASVLDLGGILWYYGNAGKSKGTAVFSGVKDLSFDNLKKGDFSADLAAIEDEFIGPVMVQAVKSRTKFSFVPLNANLAVKYDLPFYKALSFGLTGNYFNWRGQPYYEGRFAAAWNGKFLGVTADIGRGSLGTVYGVALNAAVARFRITAGFSNGFGGTIPYTSIPLKANNKILTLGITYDL